MQPINICDISTDALDLVLKFAQHNPMRTLVCKAWYGRVCEAKKKELFIEVAQLNALVQTQFTTPLQMDKAKIQNLSCLSDVVIARSEYRCQIHEKIAKLIPQIYPFALHMQTAHSYLENAQVVSQELSRPENNFITQAKQFWEECNEVLNEITPDDLALLFWIQNGQYSMALELLTKLPRYALNVPFKLKALNAEESPFYNTDRGNIINLIVGYLCSRGDWRELFSIVGKEYRKVSEMDLEFASDNFIEFNLKAKISTKFSTSLAVLHDLISRSDPLIREDLISGIRHSINIEEINELLENYS